MYHLFVKRFLRSIKWYSGMRCAHWEKSSKMPWSSWNSRWLWDLIVIFLQPEHWIRICWIYYIILRIFINHWTIIKRIALNILFVNNITAVILILLFGELLHSAVAVANPRVDLDGRETSVVIEHSECPNEVIFLQSSIEKIRNFTLALLLSFPHSVGSRSAKDKSFVN